MAPETEAIVRASWDRIQPHAAGFAGRFYDHLFAQDPDVARLFAATDMSRQQHKFADMLGALVQLLDEPAALVGETAACGRRHAGYGATQRGYASVGAALIATLADELGDAFTPELRDAWRELYGLAAAVMQRAGRA